MLIKELDIPLINALCYLFPHLMGRPPLDHIEARPSVLGFGARGGTYEEVVLEFALQAVLFDVVG